MVPQWCMTDHMRQTVKRDGSLMPVRSLGNGPHDKLVHYSRDANIMHLLKCLFFSEAAWEFCLSATYIPGQQNDKVDDWHSLSPRHPRLLPTNSIACSSHRHAHEEHSQTDHPKAGGSYSDRGLAVSTQNAYKSSITKYVQFCSQYQVTCPLPVPRLGLSPGTFKTYSAAVHHLQIAQNYLTRVRSNQWRSSVLWRLGQNKKRVCTTTPPMETNHAGDLPQRSGILGTQSIRV